MSLLDEAMETCTMYDKRMVEDGYGGFRPGYFPGVSFKAAITVDNSVDAQVALVAQAIGNYTVTTRKNINLQYHDVFKRNSDDKIFRVTSDGDDNKTPDSAGLDMRVVTAAEWSLPNE